MSKKPAREKPAKRKEPATAAGAGGDAPQPQPKRSKLVLALLVLVPLLVLAGGGYAGWVLFLAPEPAAEVHAQGDAHAPDPVRVAAMLPDVRAEVSATHSYAIAVLMEPACGAPPTPKLQAASEAEAAADGAMVNHSWIAAARRTKSLNDKTCSYLWKEVEAAEWKVDKGAAPAARPGHH